MRKQPEFPSGPGAENDFSGLLAMCPRVRHSERRLHACASAKYTKINPTHYCMMLGRDGDS